MKIPVLVNKIVKAVCTTLLVLGMSPVLTMAQNAGFSASQMLEELNTNLGQARELEVKLKANRALKQSYDREKAAAERERREYDRDLEQYNKDLAGFNREVARYDEQCDKKLDREAYNACEAFADRLEPRKRSLDQRLAALDERRSKIMAQISRLNQQDSERALAAEKLLEQYDVYDRNARNLVERLGTVPAIMNSNRNCSSLPSLEAVHQCMAKILGL